MSDTQECSVLTAVTEVGEAVSKACSEVPWNGSPKIKRSFDFNLITLLFRICKMETVTVYARHKEDDAKISQQMPVKQLDPVVVKSVKEILWKKIHLQEISIACHRECLLAVQQRRNTMNRNSARSLLGTDMWQRIVWDIISDCILMLMQTEAELRLQKQLNSQIS